MSFDSDIKINFAGTAAFSKPPPATYFLDDDHVPLPKWFAKHFADARPWFYVQFRGVRTQIGSYADWVFFCERHQTPSPEVSDD
jgi:hypothetical protein